MFTLSNIIGFTLIAFVSFILLLPLLLAFMEDWKKATMMLFLIVCSCVLAVGVAVLINSFLAVVFVGVMIGLIIGVVWEKHNDYNPSLIVSV